ncbi:unnamed protein product [Meganyctiphanes norvegica]|uniref:Uncharacterized protein n=1 Tax=Meganyctiphanes norvegica TaxID=48144 RepID=A0AAV2RQ59_MEGNR
MLPEDNISEPECIQCRVGNCSEHGQCEPWKHHETLYGHSRHTQNTRTLPMAIPGARGGGTRARAPRARAASLVPLQPSQGSLSNMALPVTVSNGAQGLPSGMAVTITPFHSLQGVPSGLAAGKTPSVAEEAEGPGVGPLDHTENNCLGASRRLTQVMNWMRDNGHEGFMLRHFAHSDSCDDPTCTPFCRMFRRVRRHVQGAQHQCMLLRTYAVLLRLHVHSCTAEACGMRACPTLRNRHQLQNANGQQQVPNVKQEDDAFDDVDMPEH